jgi:hypothetical protein
MKRLDLRAKASLHNSPPPKNWAETSNGLAIRPLDKDYYLNQQKHRGYCSVYPPLPRGSRIPTAIMAMIVEMRDAICDISKLMASEQSKKERGEGWCRP